MSRKYFRAIGQQFGALHAHGYPRLSVDVPEWAHAEAKAACQAQRTEWRKNVRRLSLEAMARAGVGKEVAP